MQPERLRTLADGIFAIALTLPGRARTRLRGALRRSAVGPAAYAASTVLAVFNATTAFALFAAVAVHFALSARRRPAEPAPG
ncbi:hypothetical protein GCM10018962_41520 [Dactylosporangium matsuzakiense]|uniref:Uncharacterized protein n=2 Tax=Dactylosporangium matsuzakiense TaxID=53360 RepID=A0A9W6KQG7_9ACTN|nr:hypothetical protein GCM10017581_070120 [Dactylosporangium matsuzakiense]